MEGKVGEFTFCLQENGIMASINYEDGVRENFFDSCKEMYLEIEDNFIEDVCDYFSEITELLTFEEKAELFGNEFCRIPFGLKGIEETKNKATLGIWIGWEGEEGFEKYHEIIGDCTARIMNRFIRAFNSAVAEFFSAIYRANKEITNNVRYS